MLPFVLCAVRLRCNSDTGCELKSQAFLATRLGRGIGGNGPSADSPPWAASSHEALTNAAILGLYVVMIGEVLSRKDQQPRLPQAQDRTLAVSNRQMPRSFQTFCQ